MPKTIKSGTVPAVDAARCTARLLLGNAAGFQDCRSETLDRLVAEGDLRHIGRGQFVVRRGDRFDAMGMVVEGSLESSVLSEDGNRHLVGLMQPGDIFGLIALLDAQGNVNDQTAREASVVLIASGKTMRALRSKDPSLIAACERQLAFRSRILYERLEADKWGSLETRVAAVLATLRKLHGSADGRGVILNVKLSQADIADLVGGSRQRTNHALKQLEREGILALRYSQITVLDSVRLVLRAKG